MDGVRRVSVVGCSGAGKTTLGRRLAAALDVPFVELDGIFHEAGWAPLPPDEFRARLAPLVAGDTWVIDGNYAAVRDQVWARADTVVWLDLPRWRVMPRVVGRTVRRIVTRTELWNGNRESLSALFGGDPDESVVLHAYRSHARNHDRYAAARVDPAWASLRFVQLASPRAVRQFLATIGAPSA
jgi:adenylate kinase family enzyme